MSRIEAPEGKMVCQLCHGDGEYVDTYLVGDGVPGMPTQIKEETVECTCDDGLLDDPEASA